MVALQCHIYYLVLQSVDTSSPDPCIWHKRKLIMSAVASILCGSYDIPVPLLLNRSTNPPYTLDIYHAS